jgi:hypothetical protein
MTAVQHRYATVDGHQLFYREAGPAFTLEAIQRQYRHGVPDPTRPHRVLTTPC